MARIRIFVTVSHISCVYMGLYARSTRVADGEDILILSQGRRSPELVRTILDAAALHTWGAVHDLSLPAPPGDDYEPGVIKRFTRRAKDAPVLRHVYAWLLRRHERELDGRYERILLRLLGNTRASAGSVEIHTHTQAYPLQPLLRIFPQATLSFFEHGLGDYHYIADRHRLRAPIRVLFADRFKRFLDQRGIPAGDVLQLELPSDFPRFAEGALGTDRCRYPLPEGRPIVFVLLEAVDMYEVPQAFYAGYIDRILGAISGPERYHFVLKPHPAQSARSIATTRARSDESGLSYTVLDDPNDRGIAAEILFARFAERTEHVFCLFSSACFYLSQLYRSPHITYHYSTEHMDRWTVNAPPMYKRHFEALKPLIREVFSERCQPY